MLYSSDLLPTGAIYSTVAPLCKLWFHSSLKSGARTNGSADLALSFPPQGGHMAMNDKMRRCWAPKLSWLVYKPVVVKAESMQVW